MYPWIIHGYAHLATGKAARKAPIPHSNPAKVAESLLARASRLCKQLQPGKSIRSHRKDSKPYQCTPVSKKVLTPVELQGEKLPEVLPQCEYEIISYGCMQVCSVAKIGNFCSTFFAIFGNF